MQASDIGSIIKNFVLIRLIGSGTYSRVYLAKDTFTGQSTAVKKIVNTQYPIEWEALERLRHPNIILLYETFVEHEHRYLVFEYCTCNLSEYILKCHISNTQITNLFLQLNSAVDAIHSQGIYHRDLKPENCFLTWYEDTVYLKLGDFGLSTTEERSNVYGCGSRRYMSYECYNPPFSHEMTYETKSSDIWSMGIILINLIAKKCPWERPSFRDSYFRFHVYVKDPDTFIQVFKVTLPVARLLRRIFSLVPRMRPNTQQIALSIASFDHLYLETDIAN